MRLVVVFAGQGGLRREHAGRLLREAPPDIAQALQGALGADAARIGDLNEAQLAENRLAQPLICAYQMMLWSLLAPRLPRPVLYGGYSLGELSAIACAGALPPGDAVALAGERARLMDEATSGPSGLLAVLGLDEETVRALAEPLGAEIAIRNGPAHVVVGGPERVLAELESVATGAGAQRVVRLGITTPSHTSVLRDAATAFGKLLRPRLRRRLEVPVLSGVDATVNRSAEAAAAALVTQIGTRLDWAACMDTVATFHTDAVLEIGPGSALSKMLLETGPRLQVRSTDEFRSDDSVVRWVLSRKGNP